MPQNRQCRLVEELVRMLIFWHARSLTLLKIFKEAVYEA
jgi:hypothetical protein